MVLYLSYLKIFSSKLLTYKEVLTEERLVVFDLYKMRKKAQKF